MNNNPPIHPDQDTINRILNLGYVGTALFSSESETSFDTDHFIAKEALNKFKEGIEKLDLDPKAKNGINNLIAYLDEKLEEHLKRQKGV